jgi:Na+/proline symporter
MFLEQIDWAIIIAIFAVILLIGALVSRRAGKNSEEFFLGGRTMPWWLLGISMVATTFSTDTPNLVTDIVRKNGVAGNWVWWAFLLTGMLTVFIYAKLWRRSKVLTDVEFYEIRYSGKTAAFLRGFRAIYLGIFFNIMIMALVSLAAIKIGSVMLGLKPWQSILYASLITVCFSTMGGLRGVLWTDFLLFVIAMIGAVAAAVFSVKHADIGSLSNLFSHPNVADKLSIIPTLKQGADGSFTPESMNLLISVLIIPLAVQWWSVWYPGAEPGGGGYLAQRMLAAKDEKNATAAVLFFNVAHYALRPWPWIIVALCSLVIFPDKAAIQDAFPDVSANIINDDLGYPAMLTFVPHGWLGLIMASLGAAYMSTISTHLNWGSSYVVNDWYKRFVNPGASQKQLVRIGRISTVIMMILAACFALLLSNALQAFQILLQIGAGTGLLFILRWFWWRINAVSELVAMITSFLIACYFQFLHSSLFPEVQLEAWHKLLIGVGLTTICWIVATFLTKPTDTEILRSFCRLVNPGGRGWKKIYAEAASQGQAIESDAEAVNVPRGIICMVMGCLLVYGALFATGMFMYGKMAEAVVLGLIALVSAVILFKLWSKKI